MARLTNSVGLGPIGLGFFPSEIGNFLSGRKKLGSANQLPGLKNRAWVYYFNTSDNVPVSLSLSLSPSLSLPPLDCTMRLINRFERLSQGILVMAESTLQSSY